MPLIQGTLAPNFAALAIDNSVSIFNNIAGRPVVMAFLSDPASVESRTLINIVQQQHQVFDDVFASLFYVVRDANDLAAFGLTDADPGIRCLYDPDRAIAKLYGLESSTDQLALPSIVALDQHLRVIASLTGEQAIHGFVPVLEAIKTIQTWRSQQKSLGHAPILVVDRIFDIPLCRQLIDCYKENGGRQSGFMREVNGVTAEFHDDAVKRRRDVMIADDGLRNTVRAMMAHRLIPLIRQAFNFEVTRIERDMVACYDSADQGFFNAHRDNTTKGTAHRRFAATINLNTEEYEGGDLIFPEFSGETYRAPTGGAIVFSGSLLHQANAVTRGVRYAYLPFLFGEAEAKIQLENSKFLDSRNGGLAEATSV